MTDKIIMVASAALMLISEMLQLGYEKAEVTAAVALIVTVVATAVRQWRRESAADRIEEKQLDVQLRRAELELATARADAQGVRVDAQEARTGRAGICADGPAPHTTH